MHKKRNKLPFLIILLTVLITFGTRGVIEKSQLERLQENTVTTDAYRAQSIDEEMLSFLRREGNAGKAVGIYLLESKFGYQRFPHAIKPQTFEKMEKKWKKQDNWAEYVNVTKSIWDDVKYFPVPESTSDPKMTVSYGNSWMYERTYGGKRGHEGTDIMADENVRGLYPIISMTDGIVTQKGWLEKGGYRIGIQSPGGAYFYYAHLESYADIEVGDEVSAGDMLGFMGDSGYGKEGTTGQFPVHLHLGIYIYPEGEEISVNPYWILRYIENQKVKCYTKI